MPVAEGFLDLVWNWNCPNISTLSDQVHDSPVIFAPLEEVIRQLGEFPTSKPTAQQYGEERSIALTFESLCSWRLPQTASLLRCQPIPESNTDFLCPFNSLYPSGKFRA
jgi:hypothetical protein